MEKVIEIKNITKIYNLYDKPTDRLKEVLFPKFSKHKEFSALKDVSFDVKKGEILGIIGKNGSGKSTILKIITNVLTPTSGEAIKGKIAALLELGAGFNMEYTGIENIYLNGQMIGFSKEEMDEKLDDIIEFADIGDHIYQPVKTYSSGMFARLAFSVAISVDPDILIVDEALSVGDVFFQNKCYRRFDDFRRRGKTILFVTHDMGSVIKYCNRCVLLNAGKKVAEGSPQEMVDLYKKIMVGQWDERDENSEKIIDQKVEKVLEENKKLWKEQMVINPDIEAYGDGRAEIIDFGIFSTDGNIGNNVYKGDYYDVKMKVRINEDNLSPIFAFKLRDVKGSELTGTNTMLENIDTSNLKKSDIVTVTFRQKQYLQPGQYLLSLGCTAFEGDNLVVYSRNYNCCVLGVVADKGTIGVFDSESQVNIVVEE